jgi:hypothetical protein
VKSEGVELGGFCGKVGLCEVPYLEPVLRLPAVGIVDEVMTGRAEQAEVFSVFVSETCVGAVVNLELDPVSVFGGG